MTPEQEKELRELQLEAELRRTYKLAFFEPYLKQMEFFAVGKDHDERALIAANQVGKSEAGAVEMAFHLTGDYPDWWPGRRFTAPVKAWTAGPSAEKVRDVMQVKLCGPFAVPDALGTGYIPRDAVVGRPTLGRGVTGAFDALRVRFKSRGRLDESAVSLLVFKSYTEGQLAFASDTIDVYHGDEESSAGIYSEARTRLQVRGGMSYLTLTPLFGWTEIINRFKTETLPNRAEITMGIYDAVKGHDRTRPRLGNYTKEGADAIVAGYPASEREARAYGVPMLGEGKVFILPDQTLMEDPIPLHLVPDHWSKIWGIDFGYDHPFAGVLLAWDREADVFHVLRTVRIKGATKDIHIPMIRAIASAPPVAWPHDGHTHDKGSGEVLADQYKDQPGRSIYGLNMLPDHAQWESGGLSLEAGIDELRSLMEQGRFKVGSDLHDWFGEYRQYHREKGKVVPLGDDLLSATRYAIMMIRRYGKTGPLMPARRNSRPASLASEPDRGWDVFTGRPL